MANNYTVGIDPSKPEYRRVFFLLILVDSAIKKIKIQQSRIRKEQISENLMTELFADIHYTLITFGNLRNLLRKIKNVLPLDIDYEKIFNIYSIKLDKLGLIRNHLEHILDGRIDGMGPKGKPLAEPNMLGNLNGNEYNFGGDKFDLEDAEILVTNLERELRVWNAENHFYPLW